MYISPIEKIYGELQTQMVQEDERLVMKAVRNVGINVDKEALIKALQYDRNQYSKGYEDGKNDALEKIRAEILDNAFSVVNPHNTYEYINVIDLDSIDEILDEYKAAGVKGNTTSHQK